MYSSSKFEWNPKERLKIFNTDILETIVASETTHHREKYTQRQQKPTSSEEVGSAHLICPEDSIKPLIPSKRPYPLTSLMTAAGGVTTTILSSSIWMGLRFGQRFGGVRRPRQSLLVGSFAGWRSSWWSFSPVARAVEADRWQDRGCIAAVGWEIGKSALKALCRGKGKGDEYGQRDDTYSLRSGQFCPQGGTSGWRVVFTAANADDYPIRILRGWVAQRSQTATT